MFFFILKLLGYPVKSVENVYINYQKLNKEQKKNRIEQLAWKIFQVHCEKCDFYSDVKNKPIISWSEIPTVSKKDLKTNIKPSKNKRTYVGSTSGSTGEAFKFAKSKFSHAAAWVYHVAELQKLGIIYSSDLQGRFYGISKTPFGRIFELLKDKILKRIRFPIFNFSESYFNSIIKKFSNKKFIYINGYTNSILQFCRHLDKRDIVLKDLSKSLVCVIPTSENCDDEDKEYISKKAGVPVYREYGCSEVGVIAMEKNDLGYEVNDFNLYIEVVDANNQPVKPGVKGRVLVTDVFNTETPFIRYEIGDYAIKHINGYIQKIDGRVNDDIVLPSGQRVPGLAFYYVAKEVLMSNNIIMEYRVVQISDVIIMFEYVGERDLNVSEKKAVVRASQKYLGLGLIYKFKRCDVLDRTKGGKLKTFVSLL